MKYRQKEPRYGNWNTCSDNTDSLSASKQALQICQGQKKKNKKRKKENKKKKKKVIFLTHNACCKVHCSDHISEEQTAKLVIGEDCMSSLESAVKLR